LKTLIRPLGFLSLLALVVVSGGCGGSRTSAKGTITYDGKPLEDGSISFDPADGQGPTFGGRIEAGKYEIEVPSGAIGKKIVRIRGNRKTGKQIEAGPPTPKGTMMDEVIFLPTVYNEKSTLTADITSGHSTPIDFDLKPAR